MIQHASRDSLASIGTFNNQPRSASSETDSSTSTSNSSLQTPLSLDSKHLPPIIHHKHVHPDLLTADPLPSSVLASLTPVVSFDPPSLSDLKPDPLRLSNAEFGFDNFNQLHRYVSQFRPTIHRHLQAPSSKSASSTSSKIAEQNKHGVFEVPAENIFFEEPEEPGYWVYLSTYFSYLILIVLGHVRDFFGKRFKSSAFEHLMPRDGYAALNSDFDSFYTRRLKARMEDCFARPVTGVAGRTISLIDRVTSDHCKTFQYTSQLKQALNISSYNYLGFAQSQGYVNERVERTLDVASVSVGGAREDVGTNELHVRCERLVARFLGVEAALLVSQGFATNSTTLPALASKGTLLISDELNHSSIRFGSRLSGGLVRQYKHNDMHDLQRLLRESISQGQPRTHRPWKKIIVLVEGIYSMEGTIVNLPALYALKSIYKFYLYVDEAHSIGALGPRGRGVCDYYGLDPSGIDVHMGTLTKSFGASGGYIAGKASMVDSLRVKNHSSVYGESMSPAVIAQIMGSLTLIAGLEKETDRVQLGKGVFVLEGEERLKRLAFNARYLSSGLRKLGFIVYGDRDSPIIPLLIFHPGKMLQFSRMMLERYAIVVVVVAYPATPLVSSRVRFCVSASHTKDDMDKILVATDAVGEVLGLKMSRRNGFGGRYGRRWSVEEVIRRSEELVEE